MPYDSEAKAKKGIKENSERYFDLCGQWKFNIYDSYRERSLAFTNPEFDSSEWDSIPVPSSWQSLGYDKHIYSNTQYPWERIQEPDAPEAPTEYNPVGCYIKKFTLPDGFKKDRVIICFEGVESAYYLYINGERIAYSEGTFRESRFDITDYITDGENTLAVEVYRWCTGSWMEDQDFFRLAGIFRPVYIYTTNEQYIADFKEVRAKALRYLKDNEEFDYDGNRYDTVYFCGIWEDKYVYSLSASSFDPETPPAIIGLPEALIVDGDNAYIRANLIEIMQEIENLV